MYLLFGLQTSYTDKGEKVGNHICCTKQSFLHHNV